VEQQQSLLPKTIFDERYEILSVAGEGGMGKVYRARHVNLDRIVAIKILRPEFALNLEAVRRFKQEAQMAQELSHANIAGVRAFGVVDSQPYIVFDFLEGQSLQNVLDEQVTFAFAEFLNVFKQAVAGVAHAHEHGVIHRDIKPGNVFLLGDDAATCSVAILDFGIAKAVETAVPSGQKLTATGVLLGTPLYMSPEQGRGEQVNYSADVYSLGCVMYNAIFGKPPFEGESAYQVLFNHSYQPLVLNAVPGGYPEGIVTVLEKSMAKEPSDRYQNAAELLVALQELARQKPGGKPSRTFQSLTKKPISKRPSGAAATKIQFRIPRPLLPAIPLLAIGLCFFCWWQFGRQPIKELETEWAQNYDTATLARRLADPNVIKPADADKVIDDLHDQLIAHPSVDAVSIFFRQAENISGFSGSHAANRAIDDGLWIIRQLHEDIWLRNPAQAREFVEQWMMFTRIRAGADDEGKQLMFLAMIFKLDCNQAGANAVSNMVIQKFAPLDNIGGDIAKLADEVAGVYADNGDKRTALQFAAIINKSTDPSLQYMAAARKARILDSMHEERQALAEWNKALQSTKLDDSATTEMKLRALQGVADDEAGLGQVAAALMHYAQLRKEASALPNAPVKWELLVRLGDGYTALNHDKEASEAFAYGLNETRAMSSTALAANDAALAAWAMVSAGRFFNHMDLAEQGVSEMGKTFALTTNLIPRQVKPIHAILGPNGSLALEQKRADAVIQKLAGAAKDAAKAAEHEALHQSLVSEWYFLRGDDLAAAQHAGLASDARVKVVGADTSPDALLAAKYYYSAQRYFDIEPWSKRVMDSTEATPAERMEARAMLANSFFYRGDYQKAKAWFFRTLHDMRSTKNPACVEGFLNHALMDERAKQYTDAADEAGDAYNLAHEFGWWHPQFRHAGFLRLAMYRMTGRWANSLEFGKILRKDVSPRHADITPPDIGRRERLKNMGLSK